MFLSKFMNKTTKVYEQNNKREPRLEKMKGAYWELTLVDLDPLKLTISNMQISSFLKKKGSSLSLNLPSCSVTRRQLFQHTASFSWQLQPAVGKAVLSCYYLPCGCAGALCRYLLCNLLLRPWFFVYYVFIEERYSIY